MGAGVPEVGKLAPGDHQQTTSRLLQPSQGQDRLLIDRAVVLWSNPGEVVLTPFMGVGSEIYGAVQAGRKGIGIELKAAYYRQAKLNIESVDVPKEEQESLALE